MTSHISNSAQRQEPWVHPWIDVAERASRGGFWTLNFKTSDIYCSDTCRLMYGISPTVYVDSGVWARRVHQDDRLTMNALAAEAQNRHEPEFRSQFRIIGPEGDCRWVDSYSEITYDADGQPENMIGFDIDVTERKQANEALERSERLVVAGRIAATVAHEINNPLEAVNNLVYLAKEEASLDRIREYLTLAEAELARAQSISRQTLAFYRADVSRQLFEVGDVMKVCLNVLDRRLRKKQIDVSVRVHSPMPLYAKRGEILQVLLNLTSNAIDAMEGQGRLQVVVNRRGNRVRLAIADNGAGISRGNRKHLFQPFFTTKGSEGTGLGLWVSRAIVNRHQGIIRVRSCTDASRSGTLFLISLPSGISGTAD
jgi:PAS domain S-box-containing protein